MSLSLKGSESESHASKKKMKPGKVDISLYPPAPVSVTVSGVT
jgi:hypothetical protein